MFFLAMYPFKHLCIFSKGFILVRVRADPELILRTLKMRWEYTLDWVPVGLGAPCFLSLPLLYQSACVQESGGNQGTWRKPVCTQKLNAQAFHTDSKVSSGSDWEPCS